MKANSKPWFRNQVVSAIQRRDKLYKKLKHSGLETDEDNFKVAKSHLQKMILKKKKSYFEEPFTVARTFLHLQPFRLKSYVQSKRFSKKSNISETIAATPLYFCL